MKRGLAMILLNACLLAPTYGGTGYAVVISQAAAARPEWKAVADALVAKHGGTLITYDERVVACVSELARLRPRYTAFVVPPEAVGRRLVFDCHRLTRSLDRDPYGDTIWGIVSAASATGALRVAQATEPALIKSAVAMTAMDSRLFERFLIISDSYVGACREKLETGRVVHFSEGRVDRAGLLATKFDEIKPDLVVGTTQATETGWPLPFDCGATLVVNGRWCSVIDRSVRVDIAPDSKPRVLVWGGNGNLGDFGRRADTMAPVLLESYGFNQLMAHAAQSWRGTAGQETLMLWQHLPGRLSLAEAWFLNNQRLIARLQASYPKEANGLLVPTDEGAGWSMEQVNSMDRELSGLLWERDTVAFYGDPALRARLDRSRLPVEVEMTLKETPSGFVVEVRVGRSLVVRADQPLCLLLERPLPPVTVTAGQQYGPIVADDFIILGTPVYDAGSAYDVVLTRK